MEGDKVKILQGDAKIEQNEYTTFYWRDIEGNRLNLNFTQAFKIRNKSWGEGLKNCSYQVREKNFKNLDFVKGKVIKVIAEEKFTGYKLILKQFPGGEKFLYQCEDVPTFDSDDRDWDGFKVCILYSDQELTAISCRYGYQIPSIDIYLRLKSADERFYQWLDLLKNK